MTDNEDMIIIQWEEDEEGDNRGVISIEEEDEVKMRKKVR